MSARPPVAILRGDLEAHPAVRAWRELPPLRASPQIIQVLRERGKTAIYRLEGVGPGGGGVIAKCSRHPRASSELIIYEHVLPHLPLTAPAFYGWHEDAEGNCWLFLEDVGDTRYSESDGTHMAVAAVWLARLHTSAARLGPFAGLSAGGPERYLGHLRAAREAIRRRLASPEPLTGPEVALQKRILSLQDLLEQRWSRLEQFCTGLPATLVHGDFRPKNVYVRAQGSEIACYPFDWETAGWGVPAADLSRIDLQFYWPAVRECWEGPELSTMQRVAAVGRIFRLLAAIDWECATLRFDSRPALSRAMCGLAVLENRLTDALPNAGVRD